MKYYVELTSDMPDISLGRLYAINERNAMLDDVGYYRPLHGWEDATGYVVEL